MNSRQQHGENIGPALNNISTENNNVFNIQLNYDINQALNSEFWDGNFHTILLHSSIEHLALDIKNIKELLIRICKYILGKLIDGDKANKVKDLKGISMAAWEFLSSLYEVH